MKTKNKILNVAEIQKLTSEAKRKKEIRTKEAEKIKRQKEIEDRKKEIEEAEDVSCFIEWITEAAKKGQNKHSIEIYGNNKDFISNVLINGKFNKKYLDTYDALQIIEFKAIAKKLKEFSPRIYTKSVKCDNSCEDSYDHINRSFVYRQWEESHTFIEFTW